MRSYSLATSCTARFNSESFTCRDLMRTSSAWKNWIVPKRAHQLAPVFYTSTIPTKAVKHAAACCGDDTPLNKKATPLFGRGSMVALAVVQHLMGRGLPHIKQRLAPQMVQ
jgi:hypothetical protein